MPWRMQVSVPLTGIPRPWMKMRVLPLPRVCTHFGGQTEEEARGCLVALKGGWACVWGVLCFLCLADITQNLRLVVEERRPHHRSHSNLLPQVSSSRRANHFAERTSLVGLPVSLLSASSLPEDPHHSGVVHCYLK